MVKKLRLKIGYLPIIDHFILGISKERDNSKFKYLDIEPVKFNSWSKLANALKKGDVDGAFIMAPYAMALRSAGVPIKSILLGHREGLGFVVNKRIRSLKELEGKSIGIPHKLSTHVILLHQYLKEHKINFNKIKLVPMAPPDFVGSLQKGKIAGYFGSEPFGAEAEHEFVGRVQVMSRDIKKHHIDCIFVLKEKNLKNKEAIQELTNSLVDSGAFMHEHPHQASKIGSEFLGQSLDVMKDVLSEKKRRVTSWDLLPLEKEFEEMQHYTVDVMHLFYKKIKVDEFIDDSFAKKSYECMNLKKGIEQRKKIFREKIVLPSTILIFALLLWQILASISIFPSAMLPSPISVLKGTLELLKNGVLFRHIFTSLYRVFSGFILAAFFGIPLGLLLGAYKKSKYAFDPIIQIIRPISPIAWIPLAILWFGVGDKPAVFIIFITAFFPILLSSHSAVKNIDLNLIKVARNFGTKGKDMLKKVILPASFPFIMVGIRISLGISWVIIVAAEMVGMRSGLGYMILDARNFLRTDLIISGMIIIGLIGFGLDRILSYFETRVKEKWAYKEF